MDEELMALVIILVMSVVYIVVFGVIYAFSCYGWYRLFKASGQERPKQVWIPIYNLYLMIKFMVDQAGLPHWMLWFSLFFWVPCLIPIIGWIASPFIALAAVIIIYVIHIKYLLAIGADAICWICLFLFQLGLPFACERYYTNGKFVGKEHF
ncbi:MAG: hypothetical protein NC548_28470 [Lachnospiraceae bacterium]|nr:hypothetical protein [Lachnospiraceae bacterium]MCM1234113.1 hypothetical protein [Ruminococcus flavefaciens]